MSTYPSTAESTAARGHLGVLDGWQGVNVLPMLATHMRPLDPKSRQFSEITGPMGEALLFTLLRSVEQWWWLKSSKRLASRFKKRGEASAPH